MPRDLLTERPGLFRVPMLALALTQAAVSVWALAAPRSFHDDFPGAGRHWVSAYPPFNEHLIVDYGSFTLGISIAVGAAAILLERRLVQVALAAWLTGAIPHLTYHAINIDAYESPDDVLNMIALGSYVLVAAVLLWLSRASVGASAASRQNDG